MISIIQKESTHEIISCNIHEENGMFQLWVTRPNGKNLKIAESTKKDEIIIIKEAIDYAIKKGDPALEL